MLDLEQTRIFVKVVECGSFTKAAGLLKESKSNVSKAVARLEAAAGTRLLRRTTRSLSLTPAGREFYEVCLHPLRALEEAHKGLVGRDARLTGAVRLTAPEDLGQFVISRVIGELARQYPGLTFEMQFTDEVIDLVRDGFDLAIRLGPLRESRLRARRVGEVSLITVASPEYLREAGTPKTPMDLAGHACMTLNAPNLMNGWELRARGQSVRVPVQSRILVNQMSAVIRLAAASSGVALVPSYTCTPYLRSGELVHILPEWTGQRYPVHMLAPLALSSVARVRVTADELTRRLRAEL